MQVAECKILEGMGKRVKVENILAAFMSWAIEFNIPPFMFEQVNNFKYMKITLHIGEEKTDNYPAY